jgi:MFS family permease
MLRSSSDRAVFDTTMYDCTLSGVTSASASDLPPATDLDLGSQPSLTAWRNAVFVIFALEGFAMASWASRVPQVRDILHASTAEMGLLLGGLAAGAILGLLASSHIVTWLGATHTIRVLYCVASAGLLAAGLIAASAPSLIALVLALAVFGAGTSIVDVAMNLSGAANERAIGRTIMPLFHASFSLGTVAGAGLGALLLLLRVPIGVHLVGTGLLAIVVTLILARYLRPAEHTGDQHSAQASSWRDRLAVWKTPRVLLIGLIVLGMAFAEGSANDWLSLAMVDGHHVDNAAGAAIFGVFVAAMTVARVLGVRLLDRFGRVPVLRASAVTAVIGLLLVITVPIVPLAIAGVVLWGFGAALGFPVGMSAASDDPRTATASVSAVATIGYCAFLIGPPVIGFLGQQFGLLNGLLIVLVLIALAGVVSGAARVPQQANPATE